MTDLQAIEFLCKNVKPYHNSKRFILENFEFGNCQEEEDSDSPLWKFKYLFIKSCRKYLANYFNKVIKRRPSIEILKEKRRLRIKISKDLNNFRQRYWFWNRIRIKKEYKNG